jgi:hypothetical protein
MSRLGRKFARAKKRANKKNLSGLPRLHVAAEAGDQGEVRDLLDAGADVNGKTTSPRLTSAVMFDIPYAVGSTALHIAATHGYHDIAAVLLNKKADVNAVNAENFTPLDCAFVSYNGMVKEHAAKKGAFFARKKTIEKAEARISDLKKTMLVLQGAGGATKMFELPDALRLAAPIKPARKPPGLS